MVLLSPGELYERDPCWPRMRNLFPPSETDLPKVAPSPNAEVLVPVRLPARGNLTVAVEVAMIRALVGTRGGVRIEVPC